MPLALARKPGQSLRIGNDVVLTLLSITDGWARVRFITTRTIRTARGELPPASDEKGRILALREGVGFSLGDDVFVSLVKLIPSRAVFGVDADRSIPVDREEVYVRRRQEGPP